MDKKNVDKIKEFKTKEMEDKRSRLVEGTLTQVEWATQRIIELSSMMHCLLLLLLRLLVKNSTIILE